jgi:hypothetical protein
MTATNDRTFFTVEARFNAWRRAELAGGMRPLPALKIGDDQVRALIESCHVAIGTGLIMDWLDMVAGGDLEGGRAAARGPIRDIAQKLYDLGYLAGQEAAGEAPPAA